MSAPIFSAMAPAYWARDLRCVPLEPNSKRPAKELKSWQGYLAALPNETNRKAWLETYPANGIGLLLGGESAPGLILVGLDIDDDRLVAPATRLLTAKGGTIAGKKGKKGATFFVLMPKGTRSTILKGTEGLGDIDVLAGGKMTVMPPSIHPETLQPYVELGASLLKTSTDQLPYVLPGELQALGVALGSSEILAFLDGSGTHEPGVALAGRMVAKGAADEDIAAIITAFLPDGYDGNALDELPGWIGSAREKGFGAAPGKARQNFPAALVELAHSEGSTFFRDRYGTAFVTVPTAEGVESCLVNSPNFKRWLRHRSFEVLRKSAGRNPMAEAIDTLDSIAAYSSETKPVFLRVGGDMDRIEVDLGRADGNVASITKNGWTVEAVAQHKLVRGEGFESLPDPKPGGDLKKLQMLLGLEEDAFLLVVAFLLNALRPKGPYFALLIEGEQGSGKSFLTHVIKRIIDPNQAQGTRLPDNEKDLMLQAKAFWLLNFDNASGIKSDISDALCSLATGGGIAVRKLYSDGDLNIVSYSRPFIINGIANFVSRTDLMERAIPLQLPPMKEGARKEEAALLAEFEEMLPEILGALYDAVSRAMRNYTQVPPPTGVRMVDAGRWILAAEPALALGNRSAIDAIIEAQEDLVFERVNDDPVVMKLRGFAIFGKTFEGTIGQLFAELECQGNSLLPRSPSQLSKALKRLRPVMGLAGMTVEFLSKSNRGARVRITVKAKGPAPAKVE